MLGEKFPPSYSFLYRQDFATFEDYCLKRWGFKKSYSYQLIESASAIEHLSAMADIPTTERQARELAKLKEPEVIRKTWEPSAGSDNHTLPLG